MAYLGLVPSVHASGGTAKRGGITKAGNAHARKALIEAAWSYRLQPRVSRVILKRHENVSEAVRQIAWKAQQRLCGRFKRLRAKGKPTQVVVTAIARELSAFLWAIAKQMQPVT
jgi:transposase